MALNILKRAGKNDNRPEKEEYYLSIAKQISQRSTCSKRRFGAIIVKEDNIIAAGYMGSARGTPNCVDLGKCAQDKVKRIDPTYCRAVHAELNAIINAARAGSSVLNGIMYLYAEDAKTNRVLYGKPCKLCRRAIVNAGISEVIVPGEKGLRRYRTEFWVKEQQKDPFIDIGEN